jgi:predicted RNA-binding Zn-ribbon protein involved in translation (DUF1610 family)
MKDKIKFQCTSCQYVFEHDAYQEKCFCPKCGQPSERCQEANQSLCCDECGAQIDATQAVCPHCGCPVTPSKQHCNECGAEFDCSLAACPQCGYPVSQAPVSPPAVSITQNSSAGFQEEEQPLPTVSSGSNTSLYYIIGGVVLFLLIGIGVFFYMNGFLRTKTAETPIGILQNGGIGTSVTPTLVVINGTNLRMRYAPSLDAEIFKWADGTNRHPEKGEKYPYLGEVGDFYKINYKGYTLYVSKQYTYVE